MRALISTLLLSFWFTAIALAEAPATTANHWVVQLPSGDVQIGVAAGDAGYDWQAAKQGQVVVAPFLVKTGATGQAVISRGNDSMQVAPDSMVEISAASEAGAGLLTRVLQQLGTLIYRVETRPDKRFEVETTYLVSVAKGTTFTIHVNADKATVSLAEGSLDVSTPDGTHRVLLAPGEIAEQFRDVPGISVNRADFSRSDWGPWDSAATDREARIPNQIRHRSRAVNAAGDNKGMGFTIGRGEPLAGFESDSHPGENGKALGRSEHNSNFGSPGNSGDKGVPNNLVEFNNGRAFENFDDLDRDIDLNDGKELADILKGRKPDL